MPKHLPSDLRQEIKFDLSHGIRPAKICSRLNVARSTVFNIQKEMGFKIELRPRLDPKIRRAIKEDLSKKTKVKDIAEKYNQSVSYVSHLNQKMGLASKRMTLNREKINEIRTKAAQKVSYTELMAEYKVSRSHICNIVNRKVWK